MEFLKTALPNEHDDQAQTEPRIEKTLPFKPCRHFTTLFLYSIWKSNFMFVNLYIRCVFLEGVLWRRARWASGLIQRSARSCTDNWPSFASTKRSLVAHWYAWFQENNLDSLCSLDKWLKCFSNQIAYQLFEWRFQIQYVDMLHKMEPLREELQSLEEAKKATDFIMKMYAIILNRFNGFTKSPIQRMTVAYFFVIDGLVSRCLQLSTAYLCLCMWVWGHLAIKYFDKAKLVFLNFSFEAWSLFKLFYLIYSFS